MEDFLTNLFIQTSWLHWLPETGIDLNLPADSISVSTIFSGAGAAILGKFTSNIGFATMPLNFLALLFGALLGNWVFAGVELPVDARLQAPIVFALAGMTVMALTMMWALRRQ